MSMPDAAAQDPQRPVDTQPVPAEHPVPADQSVSEQPVPAEHPVPADPAAAEQAGQPAQGERPAADSPAEAREPVQEQRQQEVRLERSVRYGRILIVAAVVCAVIVVLLALAFPVDEAAEYTKGQVVGISALLGGGIGLALGGILTVVLGAAARRRTGTGVAIQTDVR